MKIYTVFLILMTGFLLAGCSGEATLNGKNNRAASSTMRKVMHYLPKEQKLEFEVAYWTTREAIGDNRDFLNTIDGKNAAEVIEMGQDYFAKRKAAGAKGYDKYSSWQDMLAGVAAERKATALPPQKLTKKDKANNVLYKLNNI